MQPRDKWLDKSGRDPSDNLAAESLLFPVASHFYALLFYLFSLNLLPYGKEKGGGTS
jgi:hypothetical protein